MQSPEEKSLILWQRITIWANSHQALVRLISLTIALLLFLVLVPPYILDFFWFSLRANRILTLMLLVFALTSLSLIWSSSQPFDAAIFLLFNIRGARPAWLDRLMLGLTKLGSGIASLLIAMIVFIVYQRLLAYEIILGTLTLWLVVEFIKYVVRRSRPFIRLKEARIVGFRARGRSFPSGHTSQSFFLATLLIQAFHVNFWIALALYALALAVGITRMYVGAHYPRDVLAGAILGSAWGLISGIVAGYIRTG